MRSIGGVLVWLIGLVTIVLFVLSKTSLSEITASPWLSASQALALVGVVLMSLTFVLGSRAMWLEDLFGGMDRVLKVHHIIGAISFLMIINHPMFLAVDALPNFNLAAKYFWPSTNVSYSLGVGALYTMIMVLILTMVVKLPYDIWLKTHDFMGLALLLSGLHVYTISSDVSTYMPLRIWIFVFLAIGAFSFVYKVFLYGSLGPKYRYIVRSVKKLNNVFEVWLDPASDGIVSKPGQFVFINFESEGLREKHPFTISSSPTQKGIRLSIKTLGDYTLKLNKLKEGQLASVWGAYGRFGKKFVGGKNDVVMIAGGIGITPFLSLLGYERDNPTDRKMWLFYAANSTEDAVYDGEIEKTKTHLKNMEYYRYFGGPKPRLSAEILFDKIGEFNNKIFYICGPQPMMESLSFQLKSRGVKSKNIVLEDFAFK